MKITNAVTPSLPDAAPRAAGYKSGLAVMVLLCIAIAPAFGQLAGTATISSAPNGGNFDYTLSLTNTGTTNIGTFWFSWTPPGQPFEYDFLPSQPLSTSQPAGWLVGPFAGFPGYSIQYYNSTGSLISPGQTATFQFTSPDSPATLQGTSFGFPITTSFIYSGSPLVGTAAQVNPVFVVPEPSTVTLVALSMAGLFAFWRKK